MDIGIFLDLMILVTFAFLFQRFGHMICLPVKKGNMAHSNVVDGPVDVGIK